MSDVDASNVSIRTEETDPITGDLVITIDGVEANRIARPQIANELAIRSRILSALADNKAFIAIASPSAAQNAAQIKALTRQINGLMRLINGLLDADD